MACLSEEERLLTMQRRGVTNGLRSAERQRMDLDFMNQMKSLQVCAF